MAWTTPTLVEICIGLEINGYLPAEFQASLPSSASDGGTAPAADGGVIPNRCCDGADRAAPFYFKAYLTDIPTVVALLRTQTTFTRSS